MYICPVASGRGGSPALAGAAGQLVFRSVLRPYFALLLLLCLGRTLLPEAWVIAWHPHRHTTHEAAYSTRHSRSRLLLTAPHRHCHAEQFYNVPFVPGSMQR